MPPKIIGHSAACLAIKTDLGHAKAKVQIKRRRQCGGHTVAEFVEQHKCQYQRGLLDALAAKEFLKRLNDRLLKVVGWRYGLGFGNADGQAYADNIKAAVIKNTCCQGRVSASISDSEPGTVRQYGRHLHGSSCPDQVPGPAVSVGGRHRELYLGWR